MRPLRVRPIITPPGTGLHRSVKHLETGEN